ncbi:MAG: nitroreductase family protein [Prevotellaceae bacterium]|jgi:nitroreductase|nr:nitroreductase family protein [Prevotellaceae bacterium]
MEFIDLITKRFSARKYSEKKVEREKLQKILEAARLAPTACNNQPFRLIVVESDEGMAKLKKASKTFDAPLAIIVCSGRDECWQRPCDRKKSGDIDASIVTDHMMLQAAESGLGSVWVCSFDPEILRKEFNIPENFEPVNLLIIGYSTDEAPNPRHFIRKNLNEIVIKESF